MCERPGGSPPLSLPEVLRRARVPRHLVPAQEAIEKASIRWQLVEEYKPLAYSLELELARLHWMVHGIAPFADGSVPFSANNSGRLSAAAAAVLFANCRENPPRDGRVTVLEMGAGTGLFARYLVEEFQLLSEQNSSGFFQGFSYFVTDSSPRTVEQWRERQVFGDHTRNIVPAACDAATVRDVVRGPVRAIFCNYLLDVLPSAILRKRASGWEQVAVRTWIRDDPALLRQFTPLTCDEIRAAAGAAEPESKMRLLPLLPLLEMESKFVAVNPELMGLEKLQSEPDGTAFLYNYGALEYLETLLDLLEPGGFILVNDYAASDGSGAASPSVERYGSTTAMGLNFPLVEAHFEQRGVTVLQPEGDDKSTLHARLLLKDSQPCTRRAFKDHFGMPAEEHITGPARQARRQASSGRIHDALASYRTAIERNPRDWLLIGEAAEFVTNQLQDSETGLALILQALELNPWYSPGLWNMLGDLLAGLERHADAHECYLQAHRIHRADAQTNLNLAQSCLIRGNAAGSLEAVAQGLAHDSNGLFRHALLDVQQQAIAMLAARWHAQRETAARRRQFDPEIL